MTIFRCTYLEIDLLFRPTKCSYVRPFARLLILDFFNSLYRYVELRLHSNASGKFWPVPVSHRCRYNDSNRREVVRHVFSSVLFAKSHMSISSCTASDHREIGDFATLTLMITCATHGATLYRDRDTRCNSRLSSTPHLQGHHEFSIYQRDCLSSMRNSQSSM